MLFYQIGIKRCIDLVAAIILLIVLAPLLFALAIAIRMRLGSPVLFKQQRPGMNGVPFTLIKFRSMTNETDVLGKLLPDVERLPPFGRFLRNNSLDELPELINILRGEMSLVGPRPLLMQYLPLYNDYQARRHEVRPGLTGWAQINGRNAITWSDKFALDIWYVDNCGFLLDIRIMFLTVFKVLRQEGVRQAEHATIEYFKGNPK